MTKTEEMLAHLGQKYDKAIVLGLERITALAACLGNPQDHLPKTIHVAGTNGKGSTIAFLKAMCEADDLKVHTYTSPNLADFKERIVINGEKISDDYFCELLERVDKAAIKNNLTPSFFELVTAAAFLGFAENPADVLLLETGLGGRLDATNIIKKPIASIITSISFDHVAILGDSLEKISFEKAHILKPDSLGIIAKTTCPEVFTSYATKIGARLLFEGKDFSYEAKENEGFSYNGEDFPKPSLLGKHQYQNASLAITCARQALHLSDSAIRKGLTSAIWPGRLQKLVFGTLIDALPNKNWEIWIDGCHNEGAAKVLADFLPRFSDKPLFAVCGMLKSKDAHSFFKILAPFFNTVYTVPINDEHDAFSPAELADIITSVSGKPAKAAKNPLSAIEQMPKSTDARILICGSLYLLGEILKENR